MKVKLFFEPSGKAREEIVLESCIPSDISLIHTWTESWFPSKDYKKWGKNVKMSNSLGEYRQGKIVEATLLKPEGGTPLKIDLLACRSYTTDTTGAKKKLPMVLFAKLRKALSVEYFDSVMNSNQEQLSELKEMLKADVWAPVSVWNAQSADRAHVVEASETLPFAVQYAKALFTLDPASAGLPPLIETEVLRG